MTFKRVALAIAFILIYMLVYRDVRVQLIKFTSHVMAPLQRTEVPVHIWGAQRTSLYVVRTDITGTFERWTNSGTEQGPASMASNKSKNLFVFTGFGDKYFLLGLVVLMLRGATWRIAGLFWALHMVITLVSAFLLSMALITGPLWLYPMNFNIAYITPFATMAFVLFRSFGRYAPSG